MLGSSKDNVDENLNKEELNKVHSADSKEIVILHKVPDTWLRIYPAPKVSGETLHSVILRCVLCQLGLTTFLILWTVIAVLTIQSFEGPQEEKVSIEFEKEQNQLIIDLATELRQITPLSPKWRNAIERRIEDERQLTMQAVGNGARIKPGEYWSLSGTFLFTVYVMTALGFGAPVPHTLWGRTCALVYAILAVPTHIYLMVNASTCVVVHLEACARHLRDKISGDMGEETKSNFNKTVKSAK
nr:TWiK family of potassium channels protein 7-like [Maniola hyperantus]